MGFKTVDQFNDDRYHGMFQLQKDGESKDVIFLYRDRSDALVCDVHYIKSNDYTGYVHCIGNGCPACKKPIRVDSKLFIPVYDISLGEIKFWDRNIRFQRIMDRDVFDKYPNPIDFVFRITRHGDFGDPKTTYTIVPIAKNNSMSYDSILSQCNAKMPDFYEEICKDFDAEKIESLFADQEDPNQYVATSELTEYKLTPRNYSAPISEVPETPVEDDLGNLEF